MIILPILTILLIIVMIRVHKHGTPNKIETQRHRDTERQK